ncbi:Uncharacterised protein [Mycobacteroides abscessus subsp. abscessus]|nr:Uncharacterised protein [Mycobacteroides abscessus subsp. abscessus]
MAEHLLEVGLGRFGEVVDHQRRVGEQLPHLRALVVEHAQRVELGATAGLLVEWQPEQELL